MTDFIVPPYQCGDGWKKIIDPLVEYCREKNIQIHQIKQKYGDLRFYTDHYTEELSDKINDASKLAQSTCEECGNPGLSRETVRGWIYVSCDEHIRV